MLCNRHLSCLIEVTEVLKSLSLIIMQHCRTQIEDLNQTTIQSIRLKTLKKTAAFDGRRASRSLQNPTFLAAAAADLISTLLQSEASAGVSKLLLHQ